MAITPLPALYRTSATFKTDLDTFFSTMLPTFSTQAESARAEVVAAQAAAALNQAAAETAAALATTNGATQVGLAADQVTLATDQVALAASEKTAAAASAALSVASANYKGLWASLTGALNMPASVSHNGAFWALNTALADVTAATPGVSASWTPIAAAGGATTTSSATDITLTAASTRVQAVTMTVAGKSLFMADATTLQTGGALQIVKNTGSISFFVRDSAGNLLIVVGPGGCAAFYLTANSTAAGTWAVGDQSVVATLHPGLVTTVNAAGVVTSLTVAALSATQAIVLYQLNGWKAKTLNIDGLTITMGAEFSVSASTSGTGAGLIRVSATQAIVAYVLTGALKAITLNVSGTTLSAGALLSPTTATGVTGCTLTLLTATTALVAYQCNTPDNIFCMTLAVEGTTLTNGAASTGVTCTANQHPQVVMLSATLGLITYYTNGSIGNVRTVTINGTTATINALLTISGCQVADIPVVALSATTAMMANLLSGQVYVFLLSISGTTVSVASTTQFANVNTNYNGVSLALMSSTRVAMLQTPTNAALGGARVALLSIDGLTVTESSALTLGGLAGVDSAHRAPRLCLLSPTQLLAAYIGIGASGYPVACTLEIAL